MDRDWHHCQYCSDRLDDDGVVPDVLVAGAPRRGDPAHPHHLRSSRSRHYRTRSCLAHGQRHPVPVRTHLAGTHQWQPGSGLREREPSSFLRKRSAVLLGRPTTRWSVQDPDPGTTHHGTDRRPPDAAHVRPSREDIRHRPGRRTAFCSYRTEDRFARHGHGKRARRSTSRRPDCVDHRHLRRRDLRSPALHASTRRQGRADVGR